MAEIQWGYAINQWKSTEVDLVVRREQQERVLKTISVGGFRGVELTMGSGRWAPFGRPELLELNFGSIRSFVDFLHSCGVDRVASWFYDPGRPAIEEGSAGRSPSIAADHEGILDSCRSFTKCLHDMDASCLVVRPMRSYWQETPVTEAKIKTAAECWNKIGKMTSEYGVRTVMHIDCLCAVRSKEDIARLLRFTDPSLTGLAIDTAELTVAGIDPVELYERYHERVRHFHFKDTHSRDTLGEFKERNAESVLLSAGGKRGIERWFWEMGTPEGLVDFPKLMKSLRNHGYAGWIIAETDQRVNPAESVLLNSWYIQKVLAHL